MNGIANKKIYSTTKVVKHFNVYRQPLDLQKLDNAIEEINKIIGKNN